MITQRAEEYNSPCFDIQQEGGPGSTGSVCGGVGPGPGGAMGSGSGAGGEVGSAGRVAGSGVGSGTGGGVGSGGRAAGSGSLWRVL